MERAPPPFTERFNMARWFLDDRIAGLYLDITRQGRMFAAFAGFAGVIGCLGLIGLSAYTAERRTKEIGIRKALGASTASVAWLLIKQFTRPVLLANALAWPIAFLCTPAASYLSGAILDVNGGAFVG